MVIHFSPNFAMNLKIHFLKSLFLEFLRTIQASIMKEHRTESQEILIRMWTVIYKCVILN